MCYNSFSFATLQLGTGMKRIILLAGIIISMSVQAMAQQVADSLPYQKHPTLPAFQILMLDSSTQVNTFEAPKNKSVVLMFFSPDCDHCEITTKEIIDNIGEFKKTKIYMFSPMSLSMIRGFYDKMGLEKYKKQIIVGQENTGFFHSYYGTRYVPHIIIYNKDKKLVAAFEGDGNIKDIILAVRQAEEGE